MTTPFISIIVIGRNEAKNIDRLFKSLSCLQDTWTCETIYVDSASTDNSLAIASLLFDNTITLEADNKLNASAGRSIGVSIASGEWFLFLDADMQLNNSCIRSFVTHFYRNNKFIGAVGNYTNIYPDGSTSKWKPVCDSLGYVQHFGGAVLLHSSAFLLENWNPCLYSNEEIDLYTRLRCRGYHVDNLNSDFITHWTIHVSLLRKVTGNVFPINSYLGKKFYGIGQLIVTRIISKDIIGLIRWWPQPFISWSLILCMIFSENLVNIL